MTLSEASPIGAAFVEAMLSKCLRQPATGDQHIEYVLESISLKLGVLASGPVVALEARQNDQLSSQRIASRPLRNRRP